MDKLIAAAETLLAHMAEVEGSEWRGIVGDGREALFVMLDRLAETGAVDGAELVDVAA